MTFRLDSISSGRTDLAISLSLSLPPLHPSKLQLSPRENKKKDPVYGNILPRTDVCNVQLFFKRVCRDLPKGGVYLKRRSYSGVHPRVSTLIQTKFSEKREKRRRGAIPQIRLLVRLI